MSAVCRRLAVFGVALGVFGGGLVLAGVPASADIPYAYHYLRQLTGANIPASAPVSGPLAEPFSVAAAANGDVYVVDAGKDVVDEFNSSGGYVAQLTGSNIPASAPVPGLFSAVRAVALDASGDVYVSDIEKAIVDEFNPAGEYVRQIGSGVLPPYGPDDGTILSMAVDDATGNIYVADSYGTETIYVFNSTGTFLEKWTGGAFNGTGGTFNVFFGGGSLYVAADNSTDPSDPAAGDVYIVIFNGRMYLSTPSATLVDRPFPMPSGEATIPAVDPSGDLFIGGGGVVSEYTSTAVLGQRLTGSDIPVEAPVSGPFGLVSSMAFDASSDLYVADAVKHVVDEYKPYLLARAVTGVPTSLASTSAVVSGSVNPLGLAASARVEYGSSTAYGLVAPAFVVGSEPPSGDAGSGSAPVAMTATLADLEPNALYHYRLDSVNANGTNVGEDGTFTTPPAPPALEGESSSAVTTTTAILNATVNPNNEATSYQFEYGQSDAYGTAVPVSGSVGEGYGRVHVGQPVAGLQPGVTYHYRVITENATGRVVGSDQTFTTAGAPPPLASTGAPALVGSSSALVTGTVDPRGVGTAYRFQVGTDTSYGVEVFGSAGAGSEAVPVSLELESLQPDTTYHYRLVANSEGGVSYGADQTFTTASVPGELLSAPVTLPLVATPAVSYPAYETSTASPGKSGVRKQTKRKRKKKTRRGKKKAKKAGSAKAAGRRDGRGRGA